jgi:hypothetical protein
MTYEKNSEEPVNIISKPMIRTRQGEQKEQQEQREKKVDSDHLKIVVFCMDKKFLAPAVSV